MQKIKRISALALIFTLLTFSVVRAEDVMQQTMRDAIYGGVVGALVGAAVLLLTDNPDDHLGYIPTGAGVGVLAGVAYGVATSGMMITSSAAEVEDGKITFNMPTIKKEKVYDEIANRYEEIEQVDLIRVKF
ncbi:MAG: hypothetical protein A2X99_01665 [Deltaproteobacteria bacterium GWB2_55_19]|nr:MAG: hypothetical protein A2X99_01665 [Deltaproteobacteria bacterium GWB2_55_19]HAO93973.1 hypothetical protein [Deltaproteobacteria bacterium]